MDHGWNPLLNICFSAPFRRCGAQISLSSMLMSWYWVGRRSNTTPFEASFFIPRAHLRLPFISCQNRSLCTCSYFLYNKCLFIHLFIRSLVTEFHLLCLRLSCRPECNVTFIERLKSDISWIFYSLFSVFVYHIAPLIAQLDFALSSSDIWVCGLNSLSFGLE